VVIEVILDSKGEMGRPRGRQSLRKYRSTDNLAKERGRGKIAQKKWKHCSSCGRGRHGGLGAIKHCGKLGRNTEDGSTKVSNTGASLGKKTLPREMSKT